MYNFSALKIMTRFTVNQYGINERKLFWVEPSVTQTAPLQTRAGSVTQVRVLCTLPFIQGFVGDGNCCVFMALLYEFRLNTHASITINQMKSLCSLQVYRYDPMRDIYHTAI